MKFAYSDLVVLAAGLSAAGIASAKQASSNPAPPAPAAGKIRSTPFPRKCPSTFPMARRSRMEKAQARSQAAVAEANKRGWPLNVAVVDSGGNLVAFAPHGRRATRLHCDLRAQGARRGEIPPADASLRGRGAEGLSSTSPRSTTSSPRAAAFR